jgi:hypothetical protein
MAADCRLHPQRLQRGPPDEGRRVKGSRTRTEASRNSPRAGAAGPGPATEGSSLAPDPEAGLCARCRFASLQTSARGSRFLRCDRSDDDPRFSRYPPLPVSACPGFEAHSDGA